MKPSPLPSSTPSPFSNPKHFFTSNAKNFSFASLPFRSKILFWLSLAFLLFGCTFVFLLQTDKSALHNAFAYSNVFMDPPLVHGGSRVALCLTGGLRQFELTAGSIRKFILSEYKNVDVFVVAPFDGDSCKIWLLSGSNVVAIHFVQQFDFPSDSIMNSVLANQMNVGRQGLIHYAELLERCTHLIKTYEYKHHFTYDWIFRIRPDSLWNKPAPPLNALSNDALYIPYANDWYGINDRLTLGNRNSSLQAMSWVSVLPTHFREGKRSMTAEPKFEELLKSFGLIHKVRRMNFSFCVLTHHTFSYPLDWFGDVRRSAPIAPLNASGSGDGRYCRPCVPDDDLPITPDFGLQKFHTDTFCNSSDPQFKDGWETEFDAMFGDDIASMRKNFNFRDNFWECVQFLEDFLVTVEIVEGVRDSYVMCARRYNQR